MAPSRSPALPVRRRLWSTVFVYFRPLLGAGRRRTGSRAAASPRSLPNPRPGPASAEERQADPAVRVVHVEVDQGDGLPGAEGQAAADHRDGRVGRHQGRHDVRPAVPAGSVRVPPAIVGGQQAAEGRQEVIVAARAEFDQRDARGRVRHEDVQQAVAALGGGAGERRAFAGDVPDRLPGPGTDFDDLRLHARIIGWISCPESRGARPTGGRPGAGPPGLRVRIRYPKEGEADMTEISQPDGARLRLARQARGLSQQQLAGVAGVTRQAVSAVESGHSDPSLRVALGLARALGMTVEELFGPGDLGDPVLAQPVAAVNGPGSRVALATVGDTFVALPLHADTAARLGFSPAGGLAAGSPSAPVGVSRGARQPWNLVPVRPIGPPRPTVVVAGCDPALPLLETPLALLDPPLAFAWWPCGSGEALRLAAAGLVHAAGVHRVGPAGPAGPARPTRPPGPSGPLAGSADTSADTADAADIPGGAEVVGFASWREGLMVRPGTRVRGLDDVARQGLRLVNREPGAQARALLDRERLRFRLDPAELPGYDSRAAGHLQVAAAIVGGLADVGVSSEPAALAYGLDFVPLAAERFDLVLPAKHAASREVQGLLRVLTSPWLLAQLASLPGYDAGRCGERAS